MTVNEGDKVTLECRVHGKPKPSLSWFHENKKIKHDADFKQSHKGTNEKKTMKQNKRRIFFGRNETKLGAKEEALNEHGVAGNTARLVIREVLVDDGGVYSCVATNEAGKSTTSSQVTVRCK